MASTSGGAKMKKSIHYSRMKQPPLIKQLKRILSEYPDGGQILKELIQNAEDAGATEVKILHDNRRINHTPSDTNDGSETTPLYTKFFKGPALCVYNDAVFTEKDWEGIQMIYSSVKEEDPLKVGRFGLGFKSIFHITDFPCVISGDRVLLIDPQQSTEKVNATLELCDLEEYSEEGLDAGAFWNALENTFGLCRSTLGENGFRGTLFWFPLREKTSDLSETIYNETKVNNLFDSFKLEASNILLFLKNIEQISLHFRDTETPIKEILKTKIEDKDGTVRQSRSAFKQHIKDANSTPESADIHAALQMVIHTSSPDTVKRQEWLVVNYFVRESASEGFRRLIQDKNLGYSPYVGVATPLDKMSEEFEGHVFCFLPLPREGERLTGLPVHVNGFFALSQNRHHMKWETEEQEGKQIDDKSILWNKALIEEALPKAYEQLVVQAIQIAETNSNEESFVTVVYNAIPLCQNSTRKTHKRWMMLENKLFEKLESRNIVYAAQTKEWIVLKKAVFSTFRTLPGKSIDTSMKEAITKCLHQIGLKYAKLPNALFDTLQMHFPYIQDLTPSVLVAHLQQRNHYKEMTCEDKVQILAYLLLEECKAVNIRNLDLLPLASNRWTAFNKTKDPVYLCTDEAVKMFPGMEDKLVMEPRKLGEPLSKSIESICKSVGTALHKPSDLFDPTSLSLQRLLLEESLFPENSCEYSSGEIRALRRLGLKEKDKIDATVMLQVANTLNNWSKDDKKSDDLTRKAAEFMEILVHHPDLLDKFCNRTTTLGSALMSVNCIPVMKKPPVDYPESLPWFSERLKTCKPEEAKGLEWSLLAGSTVPVVNCASDKIVHMFKWNVAPKMDIVLHQLSFIRENYNVRNKPDYMRAVKTIYKHLIKFRDDVAKYQNILENNAVVWTGSGFDLPRKVIISKREQDLDLKPYYYNLPEEMKDLNDLFLQIGCHTEENSDILFNVLQSIKLKYESSSELTESSFSRDTDIILEILKVLSSRRKDGTLDIDDAKLLMLVESQSTEKLSLQCVSDCIFDDDRDELDQEEQKIFYIVNEVVPESVARELGVKSVKRKTILEATEEFSFEQWGQQESLTTRINTLLRDGYKDGLSVPKEVVQNADDAGATVLKFLYDERDNNDAKRKEKLLSKDLSECQGPALWVYNDSQFTEKDLVNITKLNGATKADYQDKIGKFGLGFCSVYNLTDVPSFISGKDMVIFDPHETYLKEARQTSGTGLRVRLSKRNLIRRNIDQFRPYSAVFGCNVLDANFTNFSGTLFRLPLRTEHQAAKSKICDEAYTKEEVSTLLSKLVENAGNILLFTQNVRSVQIYYLSKDEIDPSRAKLLFNIDKKMNRCSHGETATYEQSILNRMPTILKSSNDFSEIQHVDIRQRLFERAFLKSTFEVSNSVETKWILSWALGKDESLKLSKNISEKGAVPLSAVAIPMTDKDDTLPLMLDNVPIGFYNKGHLFCFLPLPITTSLPVYVNGCFSVTSDRRGLSCLTEDDKKKGDAYMWNEALMKDSLVRSYVELLVFLSTRCSESYSYHSLWPLVGSDDIQVFKRSFYKYLAVDKPKLFRGAKCWLSVDEVVFLDPVIRCNDIIGDISFEFVSSVPIRQGKHIIELPLPVLKALQECGYDTESIVSKAIINEEELIIHFLATLDSVFWQDMSDKRNTLILYALNMESRNVFTKLQETRCIPSEPNYVLCRPNELIDPRSDVADMFDVTDGKFPTKAGGFRERRVILQLVSLGMHDRLIPTDMLLERCKSIEDLCSVCGCCAQERCGKILKYCGNWEVIKNLETNTAILNVIKDTLMLPVLPCPSDWKFSWNGNSLEEYTSNANCGNHLSDIETSVRFEKPTKLFRESFNSCTGSVCSFVHERFLKKKYSLSERLFIALDVKSELTLELLMQQLTLLSDQYVSSEQQFSNVDAIMKLVYDLLGQLTGDKSEEEISRIQCFHDLRETPLILIGKELVMPCKVAFKVKAECLPELYCLKEVEYKRKKVFKALGVKENFSVDYLLSILNRLHKTWFERTCTDIDMVTSLLLNLCESMKLEEIVYENLKDHAADIVAPDSDGILRPTLELVIEDPAYNSSASLHILHGNIPPDTGRKLGVKSKQRKIVEFFSSGFFEPFGQNESLVTRLTGILEDYPCDSSIMKELIQNADDAGATEIYFIKNYDSHSTEKIFGNEGLQGPSLCIFNDSYFTEDDFRGIRNLGVGSKREDPSKTGQYGIGFNAVYHLTDVPSFLTKGPGLGNGGQMCIFDPLMTYLEGHATNDNPGIKCDAELMVESFPDMLLGYPVIPSIEKTGQGTIFRLPLRQSKSEISSNVVSEEGMDQLIEAFKNDMFESLLFLKSIKCIKVLNSRNGELSEEFSVEAKFSDEDALSRTRYFSRIKEVVKANIESQHQNLYMEPIEVSYTVNIEDNMDRSERWLIVNRYGIEHTDKKYADIISALKEKDIGLTPISSVALPWPEEDWKKCFDRKRLENQGKREANICARKAFCYLPLPLATGLPFHVNGHFALDKARTKLWNEGIRQSWNSFVIAELLSRACVSAVQYMRKEFVCKQSAEMNNKNVRLVVFEKYHELFPHWENATDLYWKSLVRNFYRIVTEEEIKIFPSIHIDSDQSTEDTKDVQLYWVALSKSENEFSGMFNVISKHVASQYAEGKPFSKSDAKSVESTLKKMGMKVIETPLWVSDTLSQSGIKYIPSCSPDDVLSFLKTFADRNENTCRLREIDVPLTETTISSFTALQCMLRYVIKSHLFKEKVEGLPLCLTNNGLLHIFTRNRPKFSSDMCDVLTGSADQFVHFQLLHLINRTEYYKAGVIKNLEVTDFVSHMAETFSPSVFQTGHHLLWNKKLGVPVKPEILERIFLFIYRRSLEVLPTSYRGEPTVNHKLFQTNVANLSSWSLVPSCYGFGSERKFELVPVCNSSHLFYQSYGHDDMEKVIKKFNIPQLDILAFSDAGKHIVNPLQKMLPSADRPVQLLECLIHYKTRIEACTLNCEESISVLSFFDARLNQMQEHMNATTLRNMLRNLPLYVSHQREVLSIEGYRDVVVMPYGIPYSGIDVWAQSTGILLLKETDKLLNLYQFLCLPTKTELEVYSEKILPNLNHFPRDTWKTHIEYIKNTILKTSFNQSFDKEQCHLMDQLKALPFVRVANVDKRVNELYDQNNRVFSCMLSDDCFLPHQYQDKSWLNFMERLELIMEPTDEMLIDFARSVEEKINSPINDTTKTQSSALIDCLFARKWTEKLASLKGIRFVVPYKVDSQRNVIANQPGNGDILICFSGAVSYKHADYCWSSLSLLFRIPPSMDMMKGLGIHEHPPIDRVVQHCQNVTEVFKEDLEKESPSICSTFVKYQMEKLYAVLQEKYDLSMQQKFQVTPLVFHTEDERMLPVKRIIIDLNADEEVRPYLYKLPNCFGPYEDLFFKLGSHKVPMCSDYCLVLEHIRDQFRDGPVPPNQLMCVKKALENIVKLCQKEREPFVSVNEVFIPDRNNVLVSSKSLTVSNNDALEERLEGKVPISFFVGFREMEILSVQDPVEPIHRWPVNLKPDILTDVVIEQISTDDVVHEECMQAQRIESLLRSPQVVEAILRLVKHQMKINKDIFKQSFAHTLMSRLNNVRITKVTGLKTCLTYKGVKVDGTDADASCFIKSEKITDTDGTEIKEYELYFQIDACEDLLFTLLDEKHGLLKLVDLCTDCILGKEMYQYLSSSLLLLEQPSNIKRKLDKIPIDAYDLPTTWNASVFPRPGTYVEEKFHCFLEQSISQFKQHEYMYVALEVEDTEDSMDPLYIYSHIISENKRTQGDSILKVKYTVDVGRSDGLITVPLYRLYRFKPKQPEKVNELVPYDIEQICSIPIDENFRRVRQMLTDAWAMNKTERKGIIRRLLMQWHPDRNRDHREYAERLFNYIHEVMIKLEHNELIDDTITNDTGKMPPDMSRSPFGSAASDAVYDRGCKLAAGFRDNIQDYNRSMRTGNYMHIRAEEAVVRHVGEAKRWHRQAVQDFKAAESNVCTGVQDQSFNWLCYKCHQASEKALKAAWFAKNANMARRREHSLTAITVGLDDRSLQNEANRLEGIIGDYSSMRYPDAVVGRNQIPSEIFDSTKAEKAIEITKRILDMSADIIE